jgi:predicted dehydrogenase
LLETGMPQPYRIGIVGTGNISQMHVDGLLRHPDRVRLTAICDIDPDTLARRSQEWGVDAAFPSVEDLLGGAELDAAIVCTPTPVRSEVVLPLIEAGVPVYCEKPFAETYAEALDIEQAARAARVKVAVDQTFRRHFAFTLGREVLATGRLGRPLHLVQVAHALRRDTGWRLERDRYVMAVMSIHWFDGYRWLLDDEAEWVHAVSSNSPATPGGDDTAVSVTIRFRRGATASLIESFSSFTRVGTCRLDCEAGGLLLDTQRLVEVREGEEPVEHPNPCDKVEAACFLLDDLLAAVEEGREPETSASDNLGSMRILEAAYCSLAEGCRVQTEEIE